MKNFLEGARFHRINVGQVNSTAAELIERGRSISSHVSGGSAFEPEAIRDRLLGLKRDHNLAHSELDEAIINKGYVLNTDVDDLDFIGVSASEVCAARSNIAKHVEDCCETVKITNAALPKSLRAKH